MNKKTYIIPVLLCFSVFFTGFILQKNDNNKHSVIYTAADLNVNYDNYEDIISDAEVIVYGEVSDIKTSILESGGLESRVDFKIYDVLKGDYRKGIYKNIVRRWFNATL